MEPKAGLVRYSGRKGRRTLSASGPVVTEKGVAMPVDEVSVDDTPPDRSPAFIAQQILCALNTRIASAVLRDVRAMAELTSISDDDSYELVAAVRRGLSSWRGGRARSIKEDIDTILTLYRVERWSRTEAA